MAKPARLYVSAAILAEYRTVLSRPELQIRKGLRQQLFQLVKSHSHSVTPSRPLRVTKDTDDNKFIECADAARRLPGDREPAPFSAVLEENQSDQFARIHCPRGAAPAGGRCHEAGFCPVISVPAP